MNWQVSKVNKTLSGVTQLKIGDICLYVWMYCMSFLYYFDPSVFVLVWWSNLSQTSLESSGLSIITRITLEIELFSALNSLAGAVKT